MRVESRDWSVIGKTTAEQSRPLLRLRLKLLLLACPESRTRQHDVEEECPAAYVSRHRCKYPHAVVCSGEVYERHRGNIRLLLFSFTISLSSNSPRKMEQLTALHQE